MLDGEHWTGFVIDTIQKLEDNSDVMSLIEFEDSVGDVIQRTKKLLKSIRKKVSKIHYLINRNQNY